MAKWKDLRRATAVMFGRHEAAVDPLERERRPPRFRSTWEWLQAGFERYSWGCGAGLVAGWSSIMGALWLAGAGAVLGAIAGLLIGSSALTELVGAGAGQAGGFLGAIAGAASAALAGFLLPYGHGLVRQLESLAVSLLAGLLIACLLTAIGLRVEPWLLRLRGYRRMSRRESDRVMPLVEDAARRMSITSLPVLWMDDDHSPAAWAHRGAVVLTAGLLRELDDAELAGVIAHELSHWDSGDSVGLTMVWACAWPIALLYNLGVWLGGLPGGRLRRQMTTRGAFGGTRDTGVAGPAAAPQSRIVAAIAWLVLWPAAVLMHWVVIPLTAVQSRRNEYDADAAAARAGFGPGLHAALEKLSLIEIGRSGWQTAMAETHPATELRLEALEGAAAGTRGRGPVVPPTPGTPPSRARADVKSGPVVIEPPARAEPPEDALKIVERGEPRPGASRAGSVSPESPAERETGELEPITADDAPPSSAPGPEPPATPAAADATPRRRALSPLPRLGGSARELEELIAAALHQPRMVGPQVIAALLESEVYVPVSSAPGGGAEAPMRCSGPGGREALAAFTDVAALTSMLQDIEDVAVERWSGERLMAACGAGEVVVLNVGGQGELTVVPHERRVIPTSGGQSLGGG